MADAAAKREARRRRILENSENRLQRITGRFSENPVQEKAPVISPSVSIPSENGLSVEDITRELINSLSEGARLTTEESNETEKHDTLSPYQQRFLLAQNLRSNPEIDSLRERLRPRTQGDISPFNDDIDNSSQLPLLKKSSPIYSLLLSDLSYVFLALAVNILCLLNLDHLFGKTLIMPYIAMLIARLFFPESRQEPQESKLLVAALILCNINPKLVQTFTRFMGMFRKISRGFSLYIFTFVMIRWIFSQFWIDLDLMPITNLISEAEFNREVYDTAN
ncbi:uncharacterized protein LOC117179390 [Belonocnema kinseyi]|uniref:uncharacterized protein LOC117179390 n=1 Tax=Belonocnema kinseyi TaxID=2817044 RepID=UPI00143DEF05|nr:uncharacterized protein LOC117179390 [Belonocnema kinseyi]XP_033227020.1 uncharacterized protein LOC117179390 [Belonocnema kinseyi]